MMERRKGAARAMALADRDAALVDDGPEIPVLVAFDPSLKCAGAAAVTLDGSATPILASAIPTAATTKRADYFLIRQVDDAKRARRVYRWARGVLRLALGRRYRVAAVALEAPSGIPTSFARPKPGDPPRPKGWRAPQDAQAFGKLVRGGQAVFDACAEAFDGDPVFVSTYGAKEAATGAKRPKEGKAAVESAVRRLFGSSVLDELLVGVKGGKAGREAVYDALAVALAALASVPVRAAIAEHSRAVSGAHGHRRAAK